MTDTLESTSLGTTDGINEGRTEGINVGARLAGTLFGVCDEGSKMAEIVGTLDGNTLGDGSGTTEGN